MSSFLVTGATGQLGSHIVAILSANPQNHVVALHGGKQDIAFPLVATALKFACPVRYVAINFSDEAALWRQQVSDLVREHKVTTVIHSAAISNVQAVFDAPDVARAVNVEATKMLAELCRGMCETFVYCSTDMVFDGEKHLREHHGQLGAFYEESECPCPLSAYGRSKLEGEQAVYDIGMARQSVDGNSTNSAKTHYIIVRCPLMFGAAYLPPCNIRINTFTKQLKQLAHPDQLVTGFVDEFRTPMSFRLCAQTILQLVGCVLPEDSPCETFHIAGETRVSRHQLLEHVRDALSSCLLSNELELGAKPHVYETILQALGRDDLIASRSVESSACTSALQSPTTSSYLTSPCLQVHRLGDSVMEKEIAFGKRNECGASEPRPADLSLSNELLINRLRAREVEVEVIPLVEDIKNALERWVALL